jgi:hypothetical protein
MSSESRSSQFDSEAQRCLNGQLQSSLAHIELAGDHVGDEARAVLAEKLNFTLKSARGSGERSCFDSNSLDQLVLFLPRRQSDLEPLQVFTGQRTLRACPTR